MLYRYFYNPDIVMTLFLFLLYYQLASMSQKKVVNFYNVCCSFFQYLVTRMVEYA